MPKKAKITAEDVCSEFYFQYFRVCKDRFIERNSDQYKKAMGDPKTKAFFVECAKELNEYKIDYVDYIGNTFEHYKKYIHPKTLINAGNLTRYSVTLNERDTAKQTTYIYERLMKSIRFISLVCKANDLPDMNAFFKYCVQHDTLGTYLMSGKISKYYLAMFNNIDMVARKTSLDSYGDIKQIVLNHKGQLDLDARKAIMTFTGAKKVSIIKITNYNINKVIGE